MQAYWFNLNLSHTLKLFTYSNFKTVRFLKESSEIDFKEQLERFLMQKSTRKLVATLLSFSKHEATLES